MRSSKFFSISADCSFLISIDFHLAARFLRAFSSSATNSSDFAIRISASAKFFSVNASVQEISLYFLSVSLAASVASSTAFFSCSTFLSYVSILF
uniref:Uncharacterized protein n=1 Tax=Schistosoma japonicum TaxID=6182 RepID=Q5C825_SCHJA|nr:unknown [Schistosoma japonicum]